MKKLALFACLTSASLLASCGMQQAPQPGAAMTDQGDLVMADVTPEGTETYAPDAGIEAQALNAWPVVKNGSQGNDVKAVQYLLGSAGISVGVDGVFGSGTESAVKTFQSRSGLSADGVVGANTWGKLIRTVRSGDNNAAVKAVQMYLGIAQDGVFGSGTLSAVKSFQSRSGLTADGIVGPGTWQALVAGTTSGGTSPAPSPTGTLTHAQAMSRLSAAGITVSSSGNCSDRNNRSCTSLTSIRAASIDGVIALKKQSGCAVRITGGTETGHSSGTYSHWNGYKIDTATSSCLDNYIYGHTKYHSTRSNGDKVYQSASGNQYAREGDHWDNTYFQGRF